MLSILLCFLLILTLYPLLKISTKRQKGAIKLFEKNRAFATILCDPQMVNTRKKEREAVIHVLNRQHVD
jgi:hypothetical protein